ncbi:fatty-acid amide hydrolase 2-A-like isoform X2 [Argiope bruennichi]|uniref:fatty-acid amide hydrolase 2-A-like isoform X2 n=1 Tax=Argiope bruennichi TaxID=94029 RepID=UPI002493FCA0|nr:fatty-acid amide hydrolase 2-A-like isoform X2 [Argiope bruennichi]
MDQVVLEGFCEDSPHPKMVTRMQRFWYWFWKISLGIVHFIAHCIYVLFYCGRGKVVPSVENPLLLKSATKLAEEIREGKLKSVDVVQAYINRILEVEPYINATVDRCFLDAMEEARMADSLIASGQYTKEQLADLKPLLGVPFSVKVLLLVKGLRCTGASKIFADLKAGDDSPSVALMKKAGAIVIATTNSAEMGMHFETNNLIHGTTCNPYDTNRTSGGSSGGESALISAAGSPLGLGNDLLGSIRVPCHFTGLFGHKPTMGLVPNLGCHPAPDPSMADYLYTGPMCRYAEDLIVSMRVLSSESGVPINFGQKADFRSLKIYYMKNIRGPMIVPVDKDISQGLENAITYFKSKYDVKTKEINMPSLYDAGRCVLNIIMNGMKDLKAVLTAGKGTHINEKLDFVKFFFGKSILSNGPLIAMNMSKLSMFYDKSKAPHYKELMDCWAKEFDSLLDDNSVLLMPTLPVTAPYHTEMFYFLPSTCYTSIFNVLGLPSTQCPVGYTSSRLPYGIQIVGRRNNDALTIACAVELEKAFGGWKSPGSL